MGCVKYFAFVCAFFCLFSLSGAVVAEYQFILNIDEGVKDISGNNLHPVTQPTEGDFRKGDVYGVIIKNARNIIKLPSKVFPGAAGRVDATFSLDARRDTQMVFFTYHQRGDAVNLLVKDGVLTGAYYNRQSKKWFYVSDSKRMLSVGKFIRAGLSWKLPGELVLYIDGREVDKISVLSDKKVNFCSDMVVNIGGSQVGTNVFNGVVSSLKITDGRDNKKQQESRKVEVRKSETLFCNAGKYKLGFCKESGNLKSLVYDSREYMTADSGESLWELRLFNNVEKKVYKFDSGDAKKFSLVPGKDGVQLIWDGIELPGGGEVGISAAITAEGNKLLWTIETGVFPENWSADFLSYPRLPCAPTAENKKEMSLIIPVFYGQKINDPFTFSQPSSGRVVGNAYTGGAHFQFTYLYGKNVPGFYVMARDPQGYYKDILWTAYPEKNTLLFTLLQSPEQRFISNCFKSLYPVETEVLNGDWYDAAKHYRKWAVKQKWCSAGTLAERRDCGDLPEWLYEADVAIRSSTLAFDWNKKTSAKELLDMNRHGHNVIIDKLKCKGFSVWYNYNTMKGTDSACAQKKWMCSFNGRSEMRSIPGVDGAVAELKKAGFATIGYINSRIYDQSLKNTHPEKLAIAPYIMRDVKGDFQCYNNVGWEGCRISEEWQNHLLDIIRRDSLENGFSGMYLDSFGRGQFFCWADNHGHKCGDTRASVSGQRRMASKIRREMRKLIPEYILSSEASIEQFIDKIDLKLHHSNIYPGAVPVWAAIYHDYQFVYGRNASMPEIFTTAAFHIGAIPGRIFTDQTEKSIITTYLKPEIVRYYHCLIAARRKYSDCIGYGEMLRPPVIKNDIPARNIKIRNSVPFAVPVVSGSAWRGKNGRIAVFFTNNTGKPAQFSFELKGREFEKCVAGDVMRIDDDGTGHNISAANGKYTLPPYGVAVVELH